MAEKAPPAVRVVLVTAPDEDVAAKLARTLVEERLIACANLIPKLRSIYRWEGAIHDEPEVLLVLKTQVALVERLIARVKSLHPYQVPEVLEVPIERGFGKYLDWVVAETTPEPLVTRRFSVSPSTRGAVFKQAIDGLGPGSEPLHLRVDLNEYQTGLIVRLPDGSGVCVLDERTDVAATNELDVEVWGHGASRADALVARVLELAAGLGLTPTNVK
ncbi:MAG: divalent-cation tolerance protein CutA [Archangium sp.]|nr:divalent-cation tolerance protein CutA [Archangium sp.]